MQKWFSAVMIIGMLCSVSVSSMTQDRQLHGEDEAVFINAQLEDPSAELMMGIYHEYGSPHVQRNLERALYWYHRAALHGSSEALGRLGDLYAKNSGIARDYRLAAYYWTHAALRGQALATLNLGNLFLLGPNPIRQDKHRALEYFKLSASQGNVDALYNVGAYYINHGNRDQGMNYLRQAAVRGHHMAQYYVNRFGPVSGL